MTQRAREPTGTQPQKTTLVEQTVATDPIAFSARTTAAPAAKAAGGNSKPVAVADSVTISEDSGAHTINVLANDSDAETANTALSTALVNAPTKGTVTHNADGSFTLRPETEALGQRLVDLHRLRRHRHQQGGRCP